MHLKGAAIDHDDNSQVAQYLIYNEKGVKRHEIVKLQVKSKWVSVKVAGIIVEIVEVWPSFSCSY